MVLEIPIIMASIMVLGSRIKMASSTSQINFPETPTLETSRISYLITASINQISYLITASINQISYLITASINQISSPTTTINPTKFLINNQTDFNRRHCSSNKAHLKLHRSSDKLLKMKT
jgi:hypothetical protein